MPPRPTLHSLRVSRTARVAILGTPASASVWWVVLHGYGQLAADFIRSFAPFVTADRCVVAPEGLSRFYVDEMDDHQNVGASWMTREAREDEIRDYVSALDTTLQHLAGETLPRTIHVLGFSQGAATASRWALLGTPPVARLVLWSGAPAHDLDLEAHAPQLRRMDLTLVVGTKDSYVSPKDREAAQERLRHYDIPVTVHTFEGGHRLDEATLKTVVGIQ